MASAVHVFERTTSRTTATDTNPVAAITITAAEFATAGFVNNDQVLILAWGLVGHAGTAETRVRVSYGGTLLIAGANGRIGTDLGAAGIERNVTWMGRLDLSTLSDLVIDIASTNTVDAYLERAALCVIRLSDFGTENTDWVWNRSTTDVAHTATYSATNRAAVTIPASSGTQDWVIFGLTLFQYLNIADNAEGQMKVDGTVVAGDFSEEGESTIEIRGSVFGTVQNLSSATHAVTIESRDDAVTATANRHWESAIIAFRKDVWEDFFYHIPGTVSVANASDVQVATITSTISTSQDVLLAGGGNLNIDTVDQNGYMWIRKGGSTIIEPVTDDASGLTNIRSYDATDEPKMVILAFDAATAGTQDYDLFAHHTGGATEDLLRTSFVLWGMELTPTGPNEGDATGTIGWAGSATGSTVRSGAASGSVTWAGTATGTRTPKGSNSGAITWAGTADGVAPVVVMDGTGNGTITWAGTATGTTVRSGASTGTIGWSGASSGVSQHRGATTGAVSWTGTGQGAVAHRGAATGTVTWVGEAQGGLIQSGTGIGSMSWTGTAAGVSTHRGAVTGSITWTGTTTGTADREGASTGTVAWDGITTGIINPFGTAGGTVDWDGVVTGVQPSTTFFKVSGSPSNLSTEMEGSYAR